jgi:hypothetical protein
MEHLTNGDQQKVMRWETPLFLTGPVIPPRAVVAMLRDSTHAVQVNCIFLSNGQYQCVGNKMARQVGGGGGGNIGTYTTEGSLTYWVNPSLWHPLMSQYKPEARLNKI